MGIRPELVVITIGSHRFPWEQRELIPLLKACDFVFAGEITDVAFKQSGRSSGSERRETDEPPFLLRGYAEYILKIYKDTQTSSRCAKLKMDEHPGC